jgi:hypothetical protein
MLILPLFNFSNRLAVRKKNRLEYVSPFPTYKYKDKPKIGQVKFNNFLLHHRDRYHITLHSLAARRHTFRPKLMRAER